MTTTKHTRSIERDDDGEYAVSCSCRTVYVSRLDTYAAAVAVDAAHKAAVANGTWQAEQDAEAARLADLAPLHAAQRELNNARDARQSAGFAVIIAKQRGGDVEAARAELVKCVARLEAAGAALAALEVSS